MEPCINNNCPYWLDKKKESNCKDVTKKIWSVHEELVSGFDEGKIIITCDKYRT